MVEIDFPHVFLDVEELAKRWHCGIGVIEMLAETGQIGCCIRPVALKIALKRNWPPEQRPNTVIPNHHHLDQEEIYNLFQHPRTPQTINSHKKKIPDAPAIKAKFSDLIVYVECIQAFESKYKKNRELDFQILAKDFTFIRWQGREIKFGETQGKVLRILWQAREDGETLDYIVWKHYGKTAGILEQVLAQNRHLAGYDAILPAGVQITLPDIVQDTNKQKIKMWQ